MAQGVDEIRKGHPKWEKIMAEWLQMKKPAQMTISGMTYIVIQDANDKEFFFRRQLEKDFYESRSWGG
jgi:hypothetical protein